MFFNCCKNFIRVKVSVDFMSVMIKSMPKLINLGQVLFFKIDRANTYPLSKKFAEIGGFVKSQFK